MYEMVAIAYTWCARGEYLGQLLIVSTYSQKGRHAQ